MSVRLRSLLKPFATRFSSRLASSGALRRALAPCGRISVTQEGEDLLLDRWFHYLGIEQGTYVDVGSGHPVRNSNTFGLHLRGWRGLTVDPNPEFTPLYRRYRPGGTHFSCGVARTPGHLTYYRFEIDELNTFSAALAADRREAGWASRESLSVATRPLREILVECAIEPGFDLLTVDAEGYDDEVLDSANLEFFRPKLVLYENLAEPGSTGGIDPLPDYSLVSQLFFSALLVRRDLLRSPD